MKAKLISRWGPTEKTEFWIGAEAGIGRGADNEVRLDAKPVSSQHARIFFDTAAGAYFLEDLGSLNGTQVDGTPVVRTERLGRLHVLQFGGVCELLFVTVDTEATEPETDKPAAGADGLAGTRVDAEPPALPGALAATGEVAPGTQVEEAPVVLPADLADEPAAAGPPPAVTPRAPESETEPEPGFVLAVIDRPGVPSRFELRSGDNLVGRSKGAEVAVASRELSRRHALLTVRGERVFVRDLGSRNHTHLDDRRLEAEVEVEVEVRSRLRFGLIEAYLLRRDDDELTMPVAVDPDADG